MVNGQHAAVNGTSGVHDNVVLEEERTTIASSTENLAEAVSTPSL